MFRVRIRLPRASMKRLQHTSSTRDERANGPRFADARIEDIDHADRLRNPPQISGLFRPEGTPRGALVVARPAERSDAAVHQRGHEPVQGRLPRPGKARLHPRHDFAEVRARRRQAQRSRKRRLHQPPSHVFRDAGQFFLRRLFQEGRDRLRLGADHFAAMVRHRQKTSCT